MANHLPEAQLALLRQRYAERLATTAQELMQLAGQAHPSADEEVATIIHRIRGSATSFGLPALSERAANAEENWSSRRDAAALRADARAIAALAEELIAKSWETLSTGEAPGEASSLRADS
ncbi:MAG: Hpt domain-containing protein [Pseudomonadota bacterium]